MRATIQVKSTIIDDENNIVYEVDKQQTFEEMDENVYSEIYDILESIQYDIVEVSGNDFDFFIRPLRKLDLSKFKIMQPTKK